MNTSPNQIGDVCNGQTCAVESRVREAGSRNRRGFTLIEIVVVVAVIAILAMLLVPRLAFIRTMATYTNEATSIQDVVQNMLVYHTTQAMWPDHFDSLLEATAVGSPTGLYGANSATNGLESNLSGVLAMTTLSANQKKSLVGLLGQVSNGSTTLTVMDHSQSASPSSDSGVLERDINASGADLSVAQVNCTAATYDSLPLPADPNAASAKVIYNSVFPNGKNANGDVIVALGVGPACTAIGKTIITAPQAYMKDSSRYGRTIVLIRVNPNGVQASLAGGLAPDGRTLNQCLGNYRVTAQR